VTAVPAGLLASWLCASILRALILAMLAPVMLDHFRCPAVLIAARWVSSNQAADGSGQEKTQAKANSSVAATTIGFTVSLHSVRNSSAPHGAQTSGFTSQSLWMNCRHVFEVSRGGW
jgi:hypothetical protein